MNSQNIKPTYILRFFFDYKAGGCLWSGNDAAYEKYGVGPLDATIYNLKGKISHEPKIKLPDVIKQNVLELDDLYSESLNWDDPAGNSPWSEEEWDDFYKRARSLHEEISKTLGDDFEVIYEQQK